MVGDSPSIAAYLPQPSSSRPPRNSRLSNSIEPIVSDRRYEIDAIIVTPTTRECDLIEPGVYEVGDVYWRARHRRGVALILPTREAEND
jgi:hypothetical protein